MEMEPNCAETSTALEDDSNFGDQEMFPRVGDEYQAEILEGVQQSTDNDTSIEFLVGLPVTVVRVVIEDKLSSTKGETGRKNFCLVPGLKEDGWSEIDEAGLLLGLYIFGKDFVKLKVFLACKTMGSILSFYYGKFYKSDGYRRWADCRKTKSRKVVLGQKIFSGFRLQELLSRLSFHTSEERRNALSKVSNLFEEGKMRLDEFVLTVKAIVGMKNFVEAMSIGKGKKDLTGMISPKANHAVSKSCSSLTPSEIVKLLTGDIRLSKAKSNDLFWEAVWPRLLARGWHSEQPKCYAAVSKQSLVFLLPGFTKFSRRRLTKGDHYFDSITDILNKVATEPTLLELDADENNNENEKKLEPDNSSDRQRQSYLQPRTSNQNSDLLKFTVVDTSLTTSNGKPFSTRQLRMFPDESIVITTSTRSSLEDSNSSTDDDIINNCSISTSVAMKKHKRKRISQKQVQPTSPNRNLVEEARVDSGFNVDQSNNESEPRELIDLNYPLLPPGFEPCDMFMMDNVQKETATQLVSMEEEQANNGRRQSTRYRPPTAKALEALADGLLTSGIKREKNRGGRCRENSRSRTNS